MNKLTSAEQMHIDNEIRALNNFDPIAVTEKIHGVHVSGSSDIDVIKDALGLQMLKGRNMQRLLEEGGDTTFSMDADKYLAVVLDLGFIEVFNHDFDHVDHYGVVRDYKENHKVFGHPTLGAVLRYDTYSYRDEDGTLVIHRNSADVSYCWKPKDPEKRHTGVLSSGGWESAVDPDWRRKDSHVWDSNMFWRGSHDAREGLRYTLRNLMIEGTLMPVWPKVGHLHMMAFINWRDRKNLSYKKLGMDGMSKATDALNKQRYLTTPEWFKAMIGHNLGD